MLIFPINLPLKKHTIKKKFNANGKLLISGEYFVLDGALALAVPTQRGQSLIVKTEKQKGVRSIHWKSLNPDKSVWFEGKYGLPKLEIIESTDKKVGTQLQKIFKAIQKLKPEFFKQKTTQIFIKSYLEFPRLWGLGTSSTLIYNLAKWSKVDPFQLLENAFGGSGYDIACAAAKGPILYQKEKKKIKIKPCEFDPPFKNQLQFVYLGKKQSSRAGIKRYKKMIKKRSDLIAEITDLTIAFSEAAKFDAFETCMQQHEDLIAKALQLPKAKDLYFKDYWGAVKSLGAWGGDFVMVSSHKSKLKTKKYFKQKGFDIIIPYKKMVKNALEMVR